MWYEGVTTTVEFEANNNKYKIICCLGCEITGDSAIIVTGDIYYVVPFAYSPSCFTDMGVYCDTIINNIDALIPILRRMVNKERHRDNDLDSIFGFSHSMVKSVSK